MTHTSKEKIIKHNIICSLDNVSPRRVLAIVSFALMIFIFAQPVQIIASAHAEDVIEETDFTTTLMLAREGDPEAMYVVALRLMEEKAESYQMDAFGWALNAARAGHPQAAELTGRFYRTGMGVDTNYVKARKWLFRALYRGSVEAAEHMENAIKKNEPRACLVAAEAKIASGFSVRKSLKELTCAANGGIVSAMIYIADYYMAKRSPNAQYLAMQWLKKAADAGDENAMQRLADLQ